MQVFFTALYCKKLQEEAGLCIDAMNLFFSSLDEEKNTSNTQENTTESVSFKIKAYNFLLLDLKVSDFWN